MEAALDLARVSPAVFLVESGQALTGDPVLRKKVRAEARITILTGTRVTAVLGEDRVRGVEIRDTEKDVTEELDVEGLFVEAGLVPNSEILAGLAELNDRGEVKIDALCRTSLRGVFAAGDVTAVPYKQIVVAAGEGAKAALSAYDYLLRKAEGGQEA